MPPMPQHSGIALSQLLEGNPVATIVIDAGHRVTHWNRACEALTGLKAADMIGGIEQWRAFYSEARPILADLIVEPAAETLLSTFYAGKVRPSASIEGAWEAEDFFPALGSSGRWLFFTAAAIRDAAGKVVGAIETLQDVTARRMAEAALRHSTAFMSQIIDGSSVATLVIDARHRITHWNHACEVLTGTRAEAVVGTSQQWKAFYPTERPIMADLILDHADHARIEHFYHGRYRPSALVPGGYEAEDFFSHMGEDGRWLFFTAAPLRNAEGRVVGAIETLQDVTQRRRAEEALRESKERFQWLSQTDSLTGLMNSRRLHEVLQAEVERAARYGRPLSIMVLDCDNFKGINDRYGHLEGDQVLKTLADTIRLTLRKSDSGFRYGGEEFVVVLPEAAESDAALLAERLRLAFADQVVQASSGESIRCTISIGVAEYSAGENQQDLIRRADEASYEAKRRGKNCVVASSNAVA